MIYEFTCNKCNKRFEQFFKVMQVNDPKPSCPECGSIAKRIEICAGHPARIVFVDNPARDITWQSKHDKWFGTEGTNHDGNAEWCRRKKQQRRNSDLKELKFYSR